MTKDNQEDNIAVGARMQRSTPSGSFLLLNLPILRTAALRSFHGHAEVKFRPF